MTHLGNKVLQLLHNHKSNKTYKNRLNDDKN